MNINGQVVYTKASNESITESRIDDGSMFIDFITEKFISDKYRLPFSHLSPVNPSTQSQWIVNVSGFGTQVPPFSHSTPNCLQTSGSTIL